MSLHFQYPTIAGATVTNTVGLALRADHTWTVDWTTLGSPVQVTLSFDGQIDPAVFPGGIALWASSISGDTSGTGALLAEIELPLGGTVAWGPNTYAETWTTTSATSVVVKQIAIDGSTLPTGINALTLSILAGQVQYSNVDGGLNIIVSPTNDPLHDPDATILWYSAGESGPATTWTNFNSLPDPSLARFTNPNPSGTFYLSFTAAVGGGTVTPSGFRNFEIDLLQYEHFTTTVTVANPGPSKPYLVFTSFAGEMGEEAGFASVTLEYKNGDVLIADVAPAPPGPGATGKFNYVVIKASEVRRQGGLNREGSVASVLTSTAFTLKATDQDYTRPYTEASGSVVVKKKAPAAPNGVPGPFSYDVKNGLPVTSTDAKLGQTIEKGRKYSSIMLDTSSDSSPAMSFPDAEGFLVFNFGRANVVGPVKYLGRLGTAELAIDASFAFPASFDVGVTVTLLSGRTPFQPPQGTNPGNFYATGSAAGRVAAQASIDDTVASGVNVNVDVVYPSDRGLGGEGLPAKGAQKLSDKVAVWGGDDLDAEVAKAKKE
jgi:hypothetical protein